MRYARLTRASVAEYLHALADRAISMDDEDDLHIAADLVLMQGNRSRFAPALAQPEVPATPTKET